MNIATLFSLTLAAALTIGGCGDDGSTDAGPGDAAMDTGALDADPADTSVPDTGPSDAGPADTGFEDAGSDGGDAGPADASMDASADAGDAASDAARDAMTDAATDAGPAPYQYATGATAGSEFPAGDCAETGDYVATGATGAPDCTDCLDYCPPMVTGITPCGWFPAEESPDEIVATFTTPIMATEVRVWATFTMPPGSYTEVAVAATSAGPFTALTGGVAVDATCAMPRSADDYTLTFALPGTALVGAVRIQTSDYNTGVDAVGIR